MRWFPGVQYSVVHSFRPYSRKLFRCAASRDVKLEVAKWKKTSGLNRRGSRGSPPG